LNTIHSAGCHHAHAQPTSNHSGNPAVKIPETFAKRIVHDHSQKQPAVQKSPSPISSTTRSTNR
jgi:hypothetical protein